MCGSLGGGDHYSEGCVDVVSFAPEGTEEKKGWYDPATATYVSTEQGDQTGCIPYPDPRVTQWSYMKVPLYPRRASTADVSRENRKCAPGGGGEPTKRQKLPCAVDTPNNAMQTERRPISKSKFPGF